MTPFALTVLNRPGTPRPCIVVDGTTYDLHNLRPQLIANPHHGLLDLLQNWQAVEPELLRLADELGKNSGSPDQVGDAASGGYSKLIGYPTKMIFCGLNYWDHLRDDLGIEDFEKADYDPLFFLKHHGAQVPPGGSIDFPKQVSKLDWEVELVAVMGGAGRYLTEGTGIELVAGYAVGLDLSARDWQMSKRHLKEFDLFGGKAFDGASPIGPLFVPARFVNADDLELKLWVNGEQKQGSSTSKMIWSIGELVEAASQHMRIEPGDLLFTGSPAGVGLVKETYLHPGDNVRAEITRLGSLEIRLV